MSEFNFIKDLHFSFGAAVREKFVGGALANEWYARYPQLFDAVDFKICCNQREQGTHFGEWLGAILLFEATGCRSLVEKYHTSGKRHSVKIEIFEHVVASNVFHYVMQDSSGCPDLFCYSEDKYDWFFCECKVNGDSLSEKQLKRFQKLYELSGKRVCVLWLKELSL